MTTPAPSPDKESVPVVWRRVSGGWMAKAPMWWVGVAMRSEAKPGQFYWKLAGGRDNYVADLETARAECHKAIEAGFDEYRYYFTSVIRNVINDLAETLGAAPGQKHLINQEPQL